MVAPPSVDLVVLGMILFISGWCPDGYVGFSLPDCHIQLNRNQGEMNNSDNKILIALAIVLLCMGLPSYVVTLKVLKTAYNKKELITTGVFSVCRNPLFAAVIFLILPGIILFFNSWLLLTIPCFMYIMCKMFLHREECLMEKEFGQEYIDYKNNTSAIFPKIWKYKR
jgi:protein-S-isoprenylcysteine O-methyltransferase Ste14